MNERYFCRYFKKMTQKTPVEYLNYYRIECAAEELQNSAKPVTEVALDCGFANLSYFIRVFRHWKGQTPGQFRQHCKAQRRK
jgi:AraC-like DNA-binding protein